MIKRKHRQKSDYDTGLEFMLALREMTADMTPKPKQHLKIKNVISNDVETYDITKSDCLPLGGDL